MKMRSYQFWFYAAALYNLLWGILNIAFPRQILAWLGMTMPPYLLPIWQVVGMFVLVYSPAYWWAARHPERHPHLIIIGLLGKFFGPIGFVRAALMGQLPWSFGWTILTNDLIWWPVFILYLREIASQRGGIIRLLRDE